ncbi:MAG: pitrilysin family protein, partial [Patescibacteria group bacterium]
MTQQKTLANGARVVLAPFSGTEAAAILVLFKIGSRNEDVPVWGGSHFIEHLMFKGTERRPRTVDISQELDRYGAQYNAYTGKDLTGYWVKIAAPQLPVAVDLLHDMLFHSKFDAEEMDREKRVIIEEIKMYEENPIMHIEDLLEEAMFNGHVLGKNIAGTADSMRAMTREDVLKYRDTFYRSENMVIVAAGNLPENVLELVESTFGTVEKRDGVIPADVLLGDQAAVGRIRRQQKDVEQVQLSLGFPTIKRGHADEAPLRLLASILGGTMSSRLFVEVRERRGLCYTVRAATDSYQDTGMLTVRAGLDATRLSEAMQVITDELRKAAQDGVTEAELRMVKDNVRGGLSLALEDSSDRAEFYARQLLFLGTVEEPADRLARYDAVMLEDVARVAKNYLRFDRMS